MTPPRKQSVVTLLVTLVLGSLASQAQTTPPAPAQSQPQSQSQPQPQPKPARTLILLDPAHGGPDTGAHLSGNLLEKDITLAFSNRLRALLATGNFAVISTRTADPATLFTTDQRAEIANHDHPSICLVLHATGSGFGVHIFTSALTPPTRSAPPIYLFRWNTAQIPSLSRSRLLADEIGASLLQAKIPVISSQASVRPLDNLTCPAIAIELAPLSNDGSSPTPASNSAYQQRVAEAIVNALTTWRTDNAGAGSVAGAAR